MPKFKGKFDPLESHTFYYTVPCRTNIFTKTHKDIYKHAGRRSNHEADVERPIEFPTKMDLTIMYPEELQYTTLLDPNNIG